MAQIALVVLLLVGLWSHGAWGVIVFDSGLSGGAGTDDQTAAEVPFTPTGTIAANSVQAAIEEVAAEAPGTDDQTAAEVPFNPTGTIAATTVQAAIAEVAIEASGTDDQTAAEVPFTPTVTVTATNVQAAIAEVADSVTAQLTQGTTFPLTPSTGDVFMITTASAAGVCDSGTVPGVAQICKFDGVDWQPQDQDDDPVIDLAAAIANGRIVTTLTNAASAVRLGDTVAQLRIWCDGAGECRQAVCTTDGLSCPTMSWYAGDTGDHDIVVATGEACNSFSRVTGAYTGSTVAPCAANLLTTSSMIGGSQLGALAKAATGFTALDATPDVTIANQWLWTAVDDTLFTDFDDGDDHSEFSVSRVIVVIFPIADGGIACSNTTNFLCNDGVDWIADAGAVAVCTFVPSAGVWSCLLPTGGVPTSLDESFDAGSTIDGATSLANALKVGGATMKHHLYQDGAGDLFIRSCDNNQANCVTRGVIMESGSDFTIKQQDGNTCLTINSDTGAWTIGTAGNCAEALTITGNVSVTGKVQGATAIRTVSSNPYTMVAADCDSMLLIATGAGQVDLLADPTNGVSGGGCLVCFYESNAVTLLLDPDENGAGTDDTIDAAAATLTLAAGDRLQLANVAGNQVCLLGVSASAWVTLPGVGVLSDAN